MNQLGFWLLGLHLLAGAPALTSSPHTCAWTFQGGSPSSSNSCVPPPVTFSSPGLKTVTLKVCTGSCSTTSKIVAVADPRPAIGKITASPASLYPGDTVTLSAPIAGMPPLSPVWTFPGGATATDNPVAFKLPPSARSLRIQLSVSNQAGSARASFNVPVLDPKPRASSILLSPSTPYLGDVISARAAVSGRPPFSYLWKLSPDGISSTASTFSWISSTASTAGTRRLDLIVANAEGSAKLSRSFRLDPPPLALSFSPDCPNLCFFKTGQTVAFTLALHQAASSLSRYEYDWNGDGSFEASSTLPIPTYAYTQPGSFRPRVRLSGAGGRTQTLLSSRILFITR